MCQKSLYCFMSFFIIICVILSNTTRYKQYLLKDGIDLYMKYAIFFVDVIFYYYYYIFSPSLLGVDTLILLARPNGIAISMTHYINTQIWFKTNIQIYPSLH